tara:strand:- start:78873 stop:80105 length:1233 start_codon:yes stop_codon:yes gene_type:complete
LKKKFAFFLLFFTVFSQTDKEVKKSDIFNYTETYRFNSVPDNGSYSIKFNDVDGDLNIQGHFGEGVIIKITHSLHWTAFHHGITSKRENIMDVFHDEILGEITIQKQKEEKIPRLESSFLLSVPININIHAKTNGGDIRVNEIQGDVKLISDGGNIGIINMQGNIFIQTNNGNILIKNSIGNYRAHATGGMIDIFNNEGSYNVSTIGGDIRLNNLTGNTELMTIGGSIFIHKLIGDNLTCRSSSGNIIAEEVVGNFSAETNDGDIDIQSLDGFCNLSVSNGNIRADYLKGKLILDAINGNIIGENIYGSVQAYTSSGDINFSIMFDSEIFDYSVNLESRIGDVRVSIPKNLPVNIQAEISGGRLAGDISSDIPLNLDNSHSNITAKGFVNEGVIPLTLFTGEGYITIIEN